MKTDNPNIVDDETLEQWHSGEVILLKNIIQWNYKGQVISEFNLNDVSVIGEYTNSDGPLFDDRFLVFVIKNGPWQHISFYARYLDVLSKVVKECFEIDLLKTELANFTHWKSIIRYPHHLKGKELFLLKPEEGYNPPKTWFQRFLFYGLGIGRYKIDNNILLSEVVQSYLRQTGAR
jgi:hypothetical protein